MYIKVKLLNGFKELLTYKIPDSWPNKNFTGQIVKVPLQNRVVPAFVESTFEKIEKNLPYKIKEVLFEEKLPKDPLYQLFTKQLAQYYAIEHTYFFKRIYSFLEEQKLKSKNPFQLTNSSGNSTKQVQLTQEQEDIVKSIKNQINEMQFSPSLLHGVTGSGKTEIYKKIIEHTIEQKKTCLLLLPEVSLAVQFQHLLKRELSNLKILGFHSATSKKEKQLLWSLIINKYPLIIIGVHLPIFLPIPNLGLIIIDEEHDINFQEKRHPHINTKEAALIRSKVYKIPILLGSATPSISSLFNVKKKNWNCFQLKKRFSGAFPQIKLIQLPSEKKRKHFWISNELYKAIQKTLERKEQVIIFLNRRGICFFIQCKYCGSIPSCTNCSVSLTLHSNEILLCHYCNFSLRTPKECIKCKHKSNSFLKKGIGTQQLLKILKSLFPNTIIERADLDTTIDKKKWRETIEKFEIGSIDILVGTQTITKGYHFPKVTLVGILWADINLGFPIYNSTEITLQQLIQVAGRAGRQSTESLVIIQTMLNHSIYQYISEEEYESFYNFEIEKRKTVLYPPYIRLAEIELKNINSKIIDKESNLASELIKEFIKKNNKNIIVLGPTQPLVHFIKKTHRRKIYLKGYQFEDLRNAYLILNKRNFKSSLFFTPNPLIL